MEWTDPKPLKVNHVGFATGFGSTGDWIVQGRFFYCTIVDKTVWFYARLLY